MRLAGFGIRDSGFGIRDSGFGIRDSGFGIRDSGFVKLLAGLGRRNPFLGFFPLPFTAFHCLSLPFTAFHCLSLPFTAFHLPYSDSIQITLAMRPVAPSRR